MVIGLFENIQFERGHVKFQTGDILLLCTDGITEAMDVQSEEFGSERLVASVSQVTERRPKKLSSKCAMTSPCSPRGVRTWTTR